MKVKVGTSVTSRVTANTGVNVDDMVSHVVSRLLEHPCSERRGAKDGDKDTLLVRGAGCLLYTSPSPRD